MASGHFRERLISITLETTLLLGQVPSRGQGGSRMFRASVILAFDPREHKCVVATKSAPQHTGQSPIDWPSAANGLIGKGCVALAEARLDSVQDIHNELRSMKRSLDKMLQSRQLKPFTDLLTSKLSQSGGTQELLLHAVLKPCDRLSWGDNVIPSIAERLGGHAAQQEAARAVMLYRTAGSGRFVNRKYQAPDSATGTIVSTTPGKQAQGMVGAASVLVGSTCGGYDGLVTDGLEAPVKQAPPQRPLEGCSTDFSTKRLRVAPAPSSPVWTPASAAMDCTPDSTYGGGAIKDMGSTGAITGAPTRTVDPTHLARKIWSGDGEGFVGAPSLTPISGWNPKRADAAEDAMDVSSSSSGRPPAISGSPLPITAPSPQHGHLLNSLLPPPHASSGYESSAFHYPSSSASRPDGVPTAAGRLGGWPDTAAWGSRLWHTSLAHEAPASTPLSVSPPLNDSAFSLPPPQPALPSLSSHLLFGTSTVSTSSCAGPHSCSMEAIAGMMRSQAVSLRKANIVKPATTDPVPSRSLTRGALRSMNQPVPQVDPNSRHPLTPSDLQRDGGKRPDRPVGVGVVITDIKRCRQKYEVKGAIYITTLYSEKVPRGSAPIEFPLVEDVMARGADMAAYSWARLVERRLDNTKRSQVSLWARDQRLNITSNTTFNGTSGSVVLALTLLQLITECTFTVDTVVTGGVSMDGGIGEVGLVPEKLEGSKVWAKKFIYP